jgi:glutathione S-transferase
MARAASRPRRAPGRAAYLQWLHWGEASLAPALGDIARHAFMRPGPSGSRRRRGRPQTAAQNLSCSGALAKGDYLVGGEPPWTSWSPTRSSSQVSASCQAISRA